MNSTKPSEENYLNELRGIIGKGLYGETLSHTAILDQESAAIPNNPSINYAKHLKRLESVTKLATGEKEKLNGRLEKLYQLRENRLETIANTAKKIEEAKSQTAPDQEKPSEYTTTESMKAEDSYKGQIDTLQAAKDSMPMIDQIIGVHKELLGVFNRREERGKTLVETLSPIYG